MAIMKNLLEAYTEEQKVALCGDIPMTQELFCSCLKTCADCGAVSAFFDLFEQYPEPGKIWIDQLIKELEMAQNYLTENNIIPERELRRRLDGFFESVRQLFGEEAVELFSDSEV